MLAALYYWLPHLDRAQRRSPAVGAGLLAGLRRLPPHLLRHAPDRAARHAAADLHLTATTAGRLNLLSSVGGFVMAIGFALVVIDVLVQLRSAPRAARPLGGGDARMGHADPAARLRLRLAAESRKVRGRPPPGEPRAVAGAGRGLPRLHAQRLAGDAGRAHDTGAPDQVIVLPRPTYLPLSTGWPPPPRRWDAVPVLFAALAGAVRRPVRLAAMGAGLARDHGPLPVGHGLSVPPHTEVEGAPPWWALIFTLVADATLFTSLVFGTLYLWIAAPNWRAAISRSPTCWRVAIATLAVAALAARASLRALRGGARGWMASPRWRCWSCGDRGRKIGALVPPRANTRSAPPRRCCSVTWRARRHRAAVPAQQRAASSRRLGLARGPPIWPDAAVGRVHAVTGAIAVGLVLALPSLVAMIGARP